MGSTKSRSKHNHPGHEERRRWRRLARTTWISAILIWGFCWALMLIAMPNVATYAAFGLLCLMFATVLWSSWQAWRGGRLAIWQQGLAAGPWLVVGGAGRPLDAARGAPEGQRATMLAAVLFLLSLGLAFVVYTAL